MSPIEIEHELLMPTLTNDLPTGTKLVLLDIDKVKFCPYCGSKAWVEYIRDGDVVSLYKKCHGDKCDVKLAVT